MDILRRIDQVVGRINTHPEYSKCVYKEFTRALREEAGRESYFLEFTRVMDPRGIPKEDKEIFELSEPQIRSRLSNAWDILARNGIDIYSLSKLGEILLPEKNHGGFRTREVQVFGFAPPGPSEVYQGIDNLVGFLNVPDIHSVLRASAAHLDLVRIHPYTDGNKRAAQLLQNFCLARTGHPPAIIPLTDSELYFNLLRGALSDRYASKSTAFQPSESERLFTEYIGSRVLASAERLETELAKNRAYDVFLTDVDQPGAVYSTAKALRNIGRRGNRDGIRVKVEKNNHGKKGEKLEVIGDIGERELGEALSVCAKRVHLKYKIVNRSCRHD